MVVTIIKVSQVVKLGWFKKAELVVCKAFEGEHTINKLKGLLSVEHMDVANDAIEVQHPIGGRLPILLRTGINYAQKERLESISQILEQY